MNVAVIRKTQVSRPLKVLVPLIQEELKPRQGRLKYPPPFPPLLPRPCHQQTTVTMGRMP
jgi:hypothetical protein